MPEYDVVIRGGTIVDGTGIPRFKSDLAIKDQKIAKISGRIPADGAKEIDASGCIVAPGAVDLHTHYDAQVNWDPYCTLSGWFGATSVTIGECGFGFAPTRPEDRDLNMRMMNRIEAIPLESMRKGMRWDWETFPQYMDSLDSQGLGVNVGPLFPFSPMRGYVLGMLEARERSSVTEAELNQMKQLFHEAMSAGAFGFSINYNMEDRPEDGGSLPSHVASDEEYFALAEVLSQFGVGHIGQTVGVGVSPEDRKWMRGILTQMIRISGRPLHVFINRDDDPAWVEEARSEGLPLIFQDAAGRLLTQFKLSEFNMYDYLPNWVEPLVGTPEERAVKLRDPNRRAAMKKDADEQPFLRTNWNVVNVLVVAHERNYKYEGMTITELAEATGKHPLDAMLDLALDEDLETEFEIPPPESEEDMRIRAERFKDPHTHISVSDGGAHTRYSTNTTWPVWWLAHWVRDREIMTLEEAHYKMSALPAWLTDFNGRGTLRVGNWADILVYNQAELGFLYDRAIYANDFPGGERRLIQKPKGFRHILVNGTVTFNGNDCTGALPGKLLRSHDMVG